MIIRRTTEQAIAYAASQTGVEATYRLMAESRGGGQTFSVKVSPGYDHERWRRISPEGRRIHAVCWHGFRDFFRALYEITPDAVAKTALATYAGSEGFEATFSATGNRNIGSQVFPLCIADACLCNDSGLRS